MEIKGSLTVKSITTAGRRANEGLNDQQVLADLQLTKYSNKHQYLRTDEEFKVKFPDISTIEPGWGVYVYNNTASTAKLLLTKSDSTLLEPLSPGQTAVYTLLDKNTTAGTWRKLEFPVGAPTAGNVVTYSATDIITPLPNTTTTATAFTIPATRTTVSSGSPTSVTLTYTVEQTLVISGRTVYQWQGKSGAEGTSFRNQGPVLYSKTIASSSLSLFSDQACETKGTPTNTYTFSGTNYSVSVNLDSSSPTVTSTAEYQGFVINPFVANVMTGIDESGSPLSQTVFFDQETEIPLPTSLPTSQYFYINAAGTLIQESSKQQGGNFFPSTPKVGDIFFYKPLRCNYKYVSTDSGWQPYPCTAVCEATWNESSYYNALAYPKNEWWWDYHYGEFRNSVIVATGPVLTLPSSISGTYTASIGNIIATIADGFYSDGTAKDYTVYVPVQMKHTGLVYGSEYFIYLKPDGTFLFTQESQLCASKLPNEASIQTGSYPSKFYLYSKEDGRNYYVDTTGSSVSITPSPCLLVAHINEEGEGEVYPFNHEPDAENVVGFYQIFYDASNTTSSITLKSEVLDPSHLTINVCNTVLQTDAYTIGGDKRTVTFVEPVEAGLQIEARWFVPTSVAIVPQDYVSTASAADFNLLNVNTLYALVNATTSTLNAPITGNINWMVKNLNYGGYSVQEATKLDDPKVVLTRTFNGAAWTPWSVAGSYCPTMTISNFDNYDGPAEYCVTQTTTGVTLNPPLDITAYWFVKYVRGTSYKMQMATRVDDPAVTLVRTFNGLGWTDWKFVNATYYNG